MARLDRLHILTAMLAFMTAGLMFFGLSSPSVAGETSLSLSSQPGDYVGSGRNHFYTSAQGTFIARRNEGNGISINFQSPSVFPYWNLEFAAPNGMPLSVGAYAAAGNFPNQSKDKPRFHVSGNSLGCYDSTGSFQIKQVTYGPDNSVTSFWAIFEQHCGSSLAALTGEVRYNANVVVNITLPKYQQKLEQGRQLSFAVSAIEQSGSTIALSAASLPPGATFTDHGNGSGTFSWTPAFDLKGIVTVPFSATNGAGSVDTVSAIIEVVGKTSLVIDSEPGDPIGLGKRAAYSLADGGFTVQRYYQNRVYVTFVTPTANPFMSAVFAAPNYFPLVAGSYDRTRSGYPEGDLHLPLLSASFEGRSCYPGQAQNGRFDIKHILYGAENAVLEFWATFEVRCDNATGSLKGEIRISANEFVNLTAPYDKLVDWGRNIGFDVSAREVSGRTVSITAQGLPAGASFIDNRNNTGTFSWVPELSAGGDKTIKFVADNGNGAVDVASTVIRVLGNNVVILGAEPENYDQGKTLYLPPKNAELTASRNYANGVSISFRSPPGGHNWDFSFAGPNDQPLTVGTFRNVNNISQPTSGYARWHIGGDGTGYHGCAGNTLQVKQVAYGPDGAVTSFWASFLQPNCTFDAFFLGEVRFNADLSLVLSGPQYKTVRKLQQITFDVSAVESTGRIVTLTATDLPVGAQFIDNRNNTGTFIWTPSSEQEGVFAPVFRADNGAGKIDIFSSTLLVPIELTVSASGNGSVGSIGVDCPGDCIGSFTAGAKIYLIAMPGPGYRFDRWIGCDDSSSDYCRVEMTRSRTVSASFVQITYQLTILSNSINGTVTGVGLNCMGNCTQLYASGSDVVLTANPGYRYRAEWKECEQVIGNTCIVKMSYAKSVIVSFAYESHFPGQAYFPLRSGNYWTYTVNDQCCITLSVLSGTTEIDRAQTIAVRDDVGFIQYYTNDADGLRLYGEEYPDFGRIVYSPPVSILPSSMKIGQSPRTSGTISGVHLYIFYSANNTVLSQEEISVPMGRFRTLKHQGSITLSSGESIASTTFLAKNIGVIKDVKTDGTDTYTLELVDTNLTGSSDFDGDGKADIGIYRGGIFSIARSRDGVPTALGLGQPGHIPAVGDYDGDGLLDVATFYRGSWMIHKSTDGSVETKIFGGPGFATVPADYDGDGKTDVAVYRDGAWSIMFSSDGTNLVSAHGGPGWVPIQADYDGDGKADLAVYINGAWAIKRSSDNGTMLTGHGGPAWKPVPGDYDGDGKADIAVYADGAWSILRSSDNGITVVGHGGPDWVPVPADYDGDGKTDVAVYHPIGAWSIKRSSDGAIQVVGHGGGPTDVPLN